MRPQQYTLPSNRINDIIFQLEGGEIGIRPESVPLALGILVLGILVFVIIWRFVRKGKR